MKKLVSVLLTLCLLSTMLVIPAMAAGFTAGTYTAAAKGMNGDVTVEVVFEADKIVSVVVTSHSETPGLSDPAIANVPAAIVEQQSLAVDTVAGATYTTVGFTAAVADAVTKAGLDAAGMGYVDKSVVILPPCMRIKDMLLKNNFHYYNYTTANVCSEYITFAIYEPDMTVWDVRVYGGCHGTSDAFGALCKGLTVDECIERLGGIQCSGSATGVDSCPDQVAQALTAAKGMLTGTLCDGCNIQH